MKRLRLIGHILFNLGFTTLFWGAFEFAYELGVPVWSGTFGFPFLHHYIIGAIICYAGYLVLTFMVNKNDRGEKYSRKR